MKTCIKLFCVLLFMFVIGCDGGGGSSDSSNTTTAVPIVEVEEPVVEEPEEPVVIADAGKDQFVTVNSLVLLDGVFSSNVEDPITYQWSFISTPDNSAVLSDYFVVNPTFEAKIKGVYVLSLMINDDSENTDVVIITVCTECSGIINDDTIWDLAGSPYIIKDRVQIAYGATLQINTSVKIIEGYYFSLDHGYSNYRTNYWDIPTIEVFGILNASGTENNRINFHNISIEGRGTNNEWFKINLDYIKVVSGAVYQATGNAIYGSLSLKNSILVDMEKCLYLWYPVEDCFIEKNIFVNCGRISASARDIIVYITQNVFYNYNQDCAIENWVNYGGIGEMIVEFNSFLDTDKFAVCLTSGYSNTHIIAKNNYWGTIDESVIESMIYDRNDDLNCDDYISYLPFLTEPDPDAPDITPYLRD